MSTADREIVMERRLSTPPDLVFEAWTRPEHVDRWMGPRGFVTETHSMNAAPGGQWLYTMRHPQHGVFPNRVRYLEVVPGERLVYDHDAGEGDEANAFRVTVTFAHDGAGGTRLTLRNVFPTAAACEAVKRFGAVEGGQQTLARLDEALGEDLAGDFVLSRHFDAPLERVWRAWTDPAHLAGWWGPAGFAVEVLHFDLRPGGLFHYRMKGPEGSPGAGAMYGRFLWRQIVPPSRLIWINSFSDAQAGLGRHPLAPLVPEEILSQVTLEADGAGTRLTLRARPLRANAEERAFFEGLKASMTQGWGGTLGQLATWLAGEDAGAAARPAPVETPVGQAGAPIA